MIDKKEVIKMKELKNIIKMYEYKNLFYVYIIEEEDSYNYYLQAKNYGVIKHIYGIPKEKNIKDLKKIINNTIMNDCYELIEDLEPEFWDDVKNAIMEV